MITDSGPKVLEYNVRFGDPETQTLLPLLDDETDLAQVMLACTKGRLCEARVSIRAGYSVAIILASGGYPGHHQTGHPITIGTVTTSTGGVNIFHAGTKLANGSLVTAGGRVMAVEAFGASVQEALDRAYAEIEKISFHGRHFRRDIAHRCVSQTPAGYEVNGPSLGAQNLRLLSNAASAGAIQPK